MSFDTLAPHYGWMEDVLAGQKLRRCRAAWLDALADRQRLLIVGVGHGRVLREILPRFPHLRITALDASAPMLAAARKNAGAHAHRIEFVHARLPDWQPEPGGRFDAIVTNFFLDCFSPPLLPAVIRSLAGVATADARWLIADFCVPPRGWRRWRALAIHRLMYGFFRLFAALPARSLTTPDAFLSAEGFSLIGRRHFDWGLLQADCWQRREFTGKTPGLLSATN